MSMDFSDSHVIIDRREVDTMALVLEGRHGIFAADVADFLSDAHKVSSDPNRSSAWAAVALAVRGRERVRTAAPARRRS